MPNSVFSLLRRAAFAVGIALSSNAFAAQVTYEFTTVDGHSGSFSYDDTLKASSPNATITGYNIPYFTLDGASLSNPLIVVNNNALREGADIVFVEGSNVTLRLYANQSLFGNTDLIGLNGRTLADFTIPAINRTRLQIGSDLSMLSSLQQVASIPEPGTSALMVLGLVGVLAARRARSSGKAATTV